MNNDFSFKRKSDLKFILDIFFAVSLYFSDVSEVQAFCFSQYLEKQVSAVLLTSRLTQRILESYKHSP